MRSAHKLDPMPSMNTEETWSPERGDPSSETRLRAPSAVAGDLVGSAATFTAAMTDALADILRFERSQS